MAASLRDPRLEDYLNDKFQSLADLDTVDSLLDAVQEQQTLLRQQLESAEKAVAISQIAWTTHNSTLDSHITLFRSESTQISRRLQASIESQTSQIVSSEFQAAIEKLQRLDVAKAYFAALSEFEELATETRRLIETDARRATEPLAVFGRATKGLEERNGEAEEAAVQLTFYVRKTYEVLWTEVERKLSSGFKEALSKIGWPKEITTLGEHQKEFKDAFEALLMLEDVGTLEGGRSRESNETLKVHPHPVLLPYRDLATPLEIRFRFHFDGDKPTNKPDKPEWFLRHILDKIATYAPFLSEEIQPLHTVDSTVSRDSIHEFITALLPVVRKKINHLLPNIATNARLLSHFYHELIKFDTTLKEDYLYAPYGLTEEWHGLTSEVLNLKTSGGFEAWLAVERDFALERYQEIISVPTAWQLDYDSVSTHAAKPTKSAIRLRELLENITETYRPLPSFSHRLKFLMEIQITVLDQYHDRLHGSVEAFKVLTSSIARTVQGMSKEEIKAVEGIGGLERLCRVAGSAAFLEEAMKDWGEDLLFLELWDELQGRVSGVQKKAFPEEEQTVAGELTVGDVADKTSQSLATGDDGGALFDEMAGSYSALRTRVEKMISDFLFSNAKDELRAYLKVASWPSTTAEPTGAVNISEMPVTPELVHLFEPIGSQLTFLSRAMAQPAFLRCVREVALALQSYVWDYVLLRYQFSYQGALQFQRDVIELDECFAEFLGGAKVMKKLEEASRLLSLRKEGDTGLKRVVEPVFADNEKAREMLAKLDIKELNVSAARGVLQRRIDAWS